MFLFYSIIYLFTMVYSQKATRLVHRGLESIENQVLIIAGNFSLDGEMLNFAQYDVATDRWNKKYDAELSSAETHGVILDVATSYSKDSLVSRLYVVGTFDTMTGTTQMQFCSVGAWNGAAFEKVGEGLCPRGNVGKVSRISAIILGNNGDLYVGGNFESRIWDGKKFINIQHLARYCGKTESWLPLTNGSITALQATRFPSVKALAWDSIGETLYIGGDFDSLDESPLTIGLAMWRHDIGFQDFPTKGVYADDYQQAGGTIYNLIFEDKSQSLFVAGNFRWIGGISCMSIAVWSRVRNEWMCLYDASRGVSTVTALLLHEQILYVAGWAAPSSDWNRQKWQLNYAIAQLNVIGYILENSYQSFGNPGHLESKKKSIKSKCNIFLSCSNLTFTSLQPSDSQKSYFKSLRPTFSPTYAKMPPWVPEWKWLEGYPGANGPIVRLVAGNYDLKHCLFIVGAFNNYQAVLKWCNNSVTGPSLSPLSPNHTVLGLVTSITHLSSTVFYKPTQPPAGPPSPEVVVIERSGAVFLSISFAVLVITVVVLVILVRQRQGFLQVPSNEPEENEQNKTIESGDHNFPLTTLSGGVDNTLDFRAVFERAMNARHLPSHESLLIIDPSEVILSKAIGEGSFGRVWSGYWRNNAVAIKEFIFAQSAIVGGSVDRNNIIDEIVGEAGIMACLRHPKILQIYGCSLTMQAIWIASELCNRGSLRLVLNDKLVELTWLQKLSICVDIADGMLYLHTRNPPIIHRDLKSHNIFVIETSPGHLIAKIGDWGSARALALSGAKSMTQGVGTACWLAPEVINNAYFSKDSDVYAFGILLWEVYTRQEVHDRLSAAQIISKVANEGLRPPLPRDCPWAELMTSCWQQNNRLRPGFNKILTTLSAMYSSAKANVRLQRLIETNKLKVNPPLPPRSPSQPETRSKAKSSPGLLIPSASYANADSYEIDEKSRLGIAETRKKSNTSPLPVAKEHYVDVLKKSSHDDIEIQLVDAAHPTDRGVSATPEIVVPPGDLNVTQISSKSNRNVVSAIARGQRKNDRHSSSESDIDISPDAGGYDTT